MILINLCIVLRCVFHFAKGLKCSADCVCVVELIVCSVLRILLTVFLDCIHTKYGTLHTILKT